ncbi:MAG: hypothetical protein JNL79_08605 [Myxococcales bacterium]|nr:hypothetical protein [Myxococcales bacterium]
MILVRQRVDGLEVACKAVGRDVYGAIDLPAPAWLELPKLTTEELDENLEFSGAQPAQRLRVTRRLSARVPIPLTDRWFDGCIEATHYVDRLDVDVDANGVEVVRRLVLQPIGATTLPPDCRSGFHLAASVPDLCVKRTPHTCPIGGDDCAAECAAGDAGSCERASAASGLAFGKLTKPQVELAERACKLDAAHCCYLGALLTHDFTATQRLEEVASAGCASAEYECCLALAIGRQNAGAPEGSSSAYAKACEAGAEGACLLSARAAEAVGNHELARRHAKVACQAEVPTACDELRRLTKGK